MTLRYVEDLNEEQWKIFTDALKAGPTPAQRRFVQKSIELFKDKKEYIEKKD